MPLPSELRKIKQSLEARQLAHQRREVRLSQDERALLSELEQLDKHLTHTILNEIRSSVTKMTGPGGNVCSCCGRAF